jgi:6-phosphofructokinase 2
MQTIVTITLNPTIDTSTATDHVVPEHKLRCDAPQYEPGGGGVNVSRAIKNLGGESLALYLAGGPTGAMLQSFLDRDDIRHQPTLISGWTRESLTVAETSSGQQYRFNMPGPTLHEHEWQSCLDTLAALDSKPAYIVASGSLPPGAPDDFYAQVAHLGRQLGARVMVDTSGEPLCRAVRAGVYLIKPNLRELSQVAGRPLEDEREQEAAATELIAHGQCEAVVVSLGAAGALLVSKDGVERLRTPTVPIKSKVGAGDSMVAGMALGLARNMRLPHAVRFGVAAGAAAVMTPGTELCRRDDTERLYRQMTLATT